MSWHLFAPSLVLVACILLGAALGSSIAWVWLMLLAAAMGVQTRALWRLYRHG